MNERKPIRRQPLTASEMGRRGAAAVNGSRTKAQRTAFARRAVQARWKGTTRAERLKAMSSALQARWGKNRKLHKAKAIRQSPPVSTVPPAPPEQAPALEATTATPAPDAHAPTA